MRTVLFYANLEVFRGAHLKLWHYFNHVQATPGYTARIAFSDASRIDDRNPWHQAPETIAANWRDLPVDVFFLGGKGWEVLERHPDWGPETPVINLLQSIQHADPNDVRFPYLSRPAVRICVSEEVKAAVEATGRVQPPILAIPSGIDLDQFAPAPNEDRPIPLLISASKRPSLGRKIAQRLEERRIPVRLLEARLPRADYLRELSQARITLFLPLDVEGFYLPPLEGFAAGTLVICPDCIGNRSFCLPNETALVPNYKVGHIVDTVTAAMFLPEAEVNRLRGKAWDIAQQYDLPRERRVFQQILAELDALWREVRAHTQAARDAPSAAAMAAN